MAVSDITAQILTQIRDEAREARAETHENFENVFHRLGLVKTSMNDVEQHVASLERQMAALLATLPVFNEAHHRLKARVTALDSRAP